MDYLFNTQTSNTSGSQTVVAVNIYQSPGNNQVKKLFCSGTFGGATVGIQVSIDGGTTWIAPDDVVFTAVGVKAFYVAEGEKIRGTITGATGTTSITLILA